MLENIGFGEMLVILLILLIFFGGKKIPEIAQGIGKGIREFKKAVSGIEDEVKNSVKEVKDAAEIKDIKPEDKK